MVPTIISRIIQYKVLKGSRVGHWHLVVEMFWCTDRFVMAVRVHNKSPPLCCHIDMRAHAGPR